MQIQNNQIFTNSTIVISPDTIKWGSHILNHSSILHIWTGKRTSEPIPIPLVLFLFFIALSCHFSGAMIISMLLLIAGTSFWLYLYWNNRNMKGIHFQLISGTVYSFLSNNDDFTDQVFELVYDIMNQTTDLTFEINFNGDGTIIDISPPKETEDDIKLSANFIEVGTSDPLINELQRLHNNFSERSNKNSEIIELIENTMQYVSLNDKNGLKKSFNQFIILGLINNCNELGLNTLIEVIKSNVY